MGRAGERGHVVSDQMSGQGPPDGGLEVVIEPSRDLGGTRVIAVSGEADLSSCEPLRQALDEVIGGGANRVELDFTHLDFIDSTGIGVLVAALKRMQAKGGEIALRSPGASVRRVLDITGLGSLFLFV
ncbi:MAG: anti-sigma factor antagonist [Actinomycetota bacterium]|jgi:anti-anti-sigma factor|nr:anti-sigma factor antagonist [Actinomycetota bacterium]